MLRKSKGLERNLALREKKKLSIKTKKLYPSSFGPFQNLEATSDSLVGLGFRVPRFRV